MVVLQRCEAKPPHDKRPPPSFATGLPEAFFILQLCPVGKGLRVNRTTTTQAALCYILSNLHEIARIPRVPTFARHRTAPSTLTTNNKRPQSSQVLTMLVHDATPSAAVSSTGFLTLNKYSVLQYGIAPFPTGFACGYCLFSLVRFPRHQRT